ncbi:MAG TPA: nucleic acid-binding protein [Methanospirillum sp.]|nr:nucleic acid-binding protein [Methanospirillum sp.]
MNNLGMNQRYEREPAKRVFAAELRETTHHFRDGTEDKSPTFVLLPTGERCNRVFVVGSLTEKKKSDGDQVFYQIRVVDPTGIFFVSAGSYQPEALHQIASIDAPNFVAVVGKPSVYQAPDGRTLVSIRAESVAAVDKTVRECWVLDTAERTLERVENAEDTPDRTKAKEIYTQTPEVWRRMVQEALSTIEI